MIGRVDIASQGQSKKEEGTSALADSWLTPFFFTLKFGIRIIVILY